MTASSRPLASHALAQGSRIIGTGHHRPEKVMTNHDLEQLVETSDEWIRQRTGIESRRIAAEEQDVADLAALAGRAALADAGLEPSEITQVIVATCSNHERSPSAAGRVAQLLGLSGPAAFDVGAACSGFEHALAVADMSLRTGTSTATLVIGAEKLSAVTDYTDRTTCILTADGAGAMVLVPSETPTISPVVWGTVPDLADAVTIDGEGPYFSQQGRQVLGWALREAPTISRQIVEAAGLTMEDIDVFVPHQANLRMIEPLAASLGLREDAIVADDIITSGNTSAATIPLAISRMREAGRIPSGATALLVGFGGGFSWAGQVVRLP
ncbi:3-oxoacyl-(acyl-carrier-protein) synthase III [Brachybacterium faecium DSM 4810]|uniref:3-oxoacyl-(Acyl-carrier-protein) synthase III n=1 Tax=Brachybacterium faecium (strain ATCC 43885 / DSM 4810 / JCM 11609 / LMG 19847 / NBRC 14762 / NCIMB 9860 / 6-10) TaxID=446465 RepID=C7MH52_BRAFD|nr:beta-ketoacyl-ACP synthase III [Brachybacterium faecium]ACU86500.1 3-oxoacyl-(acyl-carrier-protein) synthase III [Brachybacterium faecium DSM 4810]